ncbi:hypothetical protein BES34_004990 [Leptospira inadai serovar Lyme]|uniref:Uncharacterized protein n=1 Tax=Leptospira inadai serovar Lyme TaxID=293084 RepID=A0ABX4YM78_9LEPT|nr:hypothetical protein BES34_004990 [Leptospira inadai serovar Lyme]
MKLQTVERQFFDRVIKLRNANRTIYLSISFGIFCNDNESKKYSGFGKQSFAKNYPDYFLFTKLLINNPY